MGPAFAELLAGELPSPDLDALAAARARAAEVIRPAGALARLDDLACFVASWHGTGRPRVSRPAALVAVASHGVCAEAVSAYPSEVTAAMDGALRQGVATAAVLAGQVGARLEVLDVGVAEPTGNLAVEDALSPDRFERAAWAGRDAVAALVDDGCDLLVFGEMGIGNTTAASAVSAALWGGEVTAWCGRGTGLDDAGLVRKVRVVESALARIGPPEPPAAPHRSLEVLRRVGGAELVAVAAGILEARLRRVPVVLDGFIITAAASVLAAVRADGLAHCIAGHRSAEPGHRLLLDRLGLEALLELDLRLGEGSGALLAVPIVRAAAAAVSEVATFDELGLR